MKKFSQNIHYERNWLWVKKSAFFLVFAECSEPKVQKTNGPNSNMRDQQD